MKLAPAQLKPLNRWLLIGLFIIFTGLHFYQLPHQNLVGDEASPMLLIDVALDFFSTSNWHYLAFPFLFYHEPLREIFSGLIVHFWGVDLVLLRLPSILFDLASFWLLVWVLLKEKVNPSLVVVSLALYITSPHLMIGRLAFADGIERFLLILAGYWLVNSLDQSSLKSVYSGWMAAVAAFLTMLNAVVLLPIISWSAVKNKVWQRPPARKGLILIGLMMLIYGGLWLGLPYLAYRLGAQSSYLDRGLWYYLGRAGQTNHDLLKGWRALNHYTSPAFASWLVVSFIGSWLTHRARLYQWLTVPAWLAILALAESSFHILTFVGLFFIQAVVVTDYWWKKNINWRRGVIFMAGLILTVNLNHFYQYFLTNRRQQPEFQIGHTNVPRYNKSLDEAVLRLYQRHP